MSTIISQQSLRVCLLNSTLPPDEKPKAVPLLLDFSGSESSYTLDADQFQSLNFLKYIQTLFIDLSKSANNLNVFVNNGRQTITALAGSQGYYTILVPNPISLVFSSAANGVVIPVQLINVAIPPFVWQVAPASVVTGNVNVLNFPATQTVDGTVDVGNFPATQPVSGSVAVSNFPTTQPISGNVGLIYPTTFALESSPAAGTVATVTAAAVTGKQVIVTSFDFAVFASSAPTASAQSLQLVDSIAGVIWNRVVAWTASIGTLIPVTQINGVQIQGAVGASVVFHFQTGISNAFQSVNMQGYYM